MNRSTVSILLLLFSCQSLFAGKVSGVVTDSSGRPLPFASVFVQGMNKGTSTNAEGRYSLTLTAGTYTLNCQYVGYARQEKSITIAQQSDLTVDFRLHVQELTLGEVVLGKGEDPAYEIIRQSILKRKYYLAQLDRYRCEVYTKGQMRLRGFPKKVMGQKVDFEDGDTSKRKMLYLSETVSVYTVDKPNKIKLEVISSKVSGQTGGYGLAAPEFLSFYENNVRVGDGLNPRGFISPVAENALNYYKYKWEGSYIEDGREINHIKVIPRRKFEPLFSGYIDIVEDEWRIHSVKLLLTRSAQMEILDTLRVEQLYRAHDKDRWFVSSQVIYPATKILGFDVYGSFVNVYSGFDPEPVIDKKTFSSTVVKYTDSANKRDEAYWEKNRPVALLADEVRDYQKKDSLEQVRKSPRYKDSIDRKNNKITPVNLLLLGQTFSISKKRQTISLAPVLEMVNFHPAEGLVLNPSVTLFKRLDTIPMGRRSYSITPEFRYGFLNRHFNPMLSFRYNYGKKYNQSFSLSGGRKVFQFNPDLPVSDRDNTFNSLIYERNIRKTYEAAFIRGSYRSGLGSGFSIVTGFQYQDRKPLENRTDYTWRKDEQRMYSPNYPNELVTANIVPHQSFIVLLGINWQPGTRYVEYPDRKVSLGSRYPNFSFQYTRGIKNILGSDADFSKWKLYVTDNLNLKLKGQFRYRVGMGGFLNNRSVELPDYQHFNGTITRFMPEYQRSFMLLPQYLFSNKDKFYAESHLEYNLKGFLTNKLPLIRKLNLYLVTGANGIYLNNHKYYYEVFAGFDNIFKQIRVDFVQSYQNGKPFQQGIRIGLSKLNLSRGREDWP
ncbi:MAG: carboxypeptidase-like regulatory domain-containing protein [Chitinophagales bacterium]|nr:carboxypeptidase-like regulatory domain-containing protein [Chitinophagales bacterium]